MEAYTFANFMKNYRKHNKLTLRGLASITGVSFSHLNKLEQVGHKPNKSTVHLLANQLKIHPEILLSIAGYEESEKENEISLDVAIKSYNTTKFLDVTKLIFFKNIFKFSSNQIASFLKISINKYMEIEDEYLEGFPSLAEVNYDIIKALSELFEVNEELLIKYVPIAMSEEEVQQIETEYQSYNSALEPQKNNSQVYSEFICKGELFEINSKEAEFLKEVLITFRKFQKK